MDVLRELESMLENLVDKYTEIKKEKTDLQTQYDELFNEYEKVNSEKEELSNLVEELKRKNDEVENHLNQIKATLISRLGDEFREENFNDQLSAEDSGPENPNQNQY